ncbi:hypothetical protein FB45DRAFT_920778 [Roridomyces roridus]|uniref:Uncharacterized protein n=1 Tax=Roridomyces roridus TaxID=1738132 RepID=A0AAD7BQ83_9AGAR|nr:hypothetical protein FB45DRAFT_920778 [Roridomyces roridus]
MDPRSSQCATSYPASSQLSRICWAPSDDDDTHAAWSTSSETLVPDATSVRARAEVANHSPRPPPPRRIKLSLPADARVDGLGSRSDHDSYLSAVLYAGANGGDDSDRECNEAEQLGNRRGDRTVLFMEMPNNTDGKLVNVVNRLRRSLSRKDTPRTVASRFHISRRVSHAECCGKAQLSV